MKNKIINRIQTIQNQLFSDQAKESSQFSYNLHQVAWDNEDNIGHGTLGKLFFLLEVYRCTKDQTCLTLIDTHLEKIETFWKKNLTNNYTFYYGRSGLIYFHLDCYELIEEQKYLEQALEVAQAYQQNYASLFSLSSKNSLYDGISGMLLVFMRLFAVSKAQWLLPLIEEFALKLIRNARISRDGLYWNGINSERILHNIGYAHGNSGIALAFIELARLFDNDAFYHLSQSALRFENVFREKENILWKKLSALDQQNNHEPKKIYYSLEYGLAGMILPRWVYNQCPKVIEAGMENQDGVEELLNFLTKIPETQETGSVAQLEWGMLALELYHRSDDIQYLQIAERIAENILNDLDWINDCTTGYFLTKYLQAKEQSYSSSYLFPQINVIGDLVFDNIELDSPLFFGLGELNHIMLKNSFKNSYKQLYAELSDELEIFNEKPHSNIFEAFQQEIIRLRKFDLEHAADNKLRIAFEKDCYIISEINHSILMSFSEQKVSEASINKIVENIKLSDDRFMDLQFSFSNDVWFLEYDPTIDLDQVLTYDEISKLVSNYGNQSYVFFRTPEYLGEQELLISKLILDRFRNPSTVRNVQQEFYKFLSCQLPEVINIIDMGLDEVTELDLEQKSQMLVIGSVKYLYEEGILELA